MIGILIYSGTSFGGLERRFARLAAHLINRGDEVMLYCTEDAADVIDWLGIKIPADRLYLLDARSSGVWIRDKANRLIGLLNLFLHLFQSRPIRHMHLAMNPGLVAALFGLSGQRYSLSVVDSNFEFQPWMFRYSIKKAVAVDCLSETIKSEVLERLQGDVLPPVLSGPCSFTDPSHVKTAQQRDIDVALIARKAPGKGHELLAAAIERMGPLNVHAKPTDDPFGVLARSKIFASLQSKENYPSQALLEAMYSRCAIIATDVGETRRMLDDNCAILIPADAEALANAIETLLSDDVRRVQMGEDAYQRASTEHTIERYADYITGLWSAAS